MELSWRNITNRGSQEGWENTDASLQVYKGAAQPRTILIGQSGNIANSNAIPTTLRHDLHRVTKQP